MARGRGQQARLAGEDSSSEVQVCPLCIEPLDADEQQFYPCPCGYQVCVFCHRKIELFCNNLCPGCRTEYGSQKDMFDPAARQSSSDNGHPSPAMPLTPAKSTFPEDAETHTLHTLPPSVKPNSLQQAGWPSLWGQQSDRSSTHAPALTPAQSSAEGTSAWPSLAASQRQVQGFSAQTPSTSQQPQSQHSAGAQAPAWQSQQTDQQQLGPSAERTRVTLAAPLTTDQVPSVQADPDGAALLQKVQSAVGNGELSIEDGTKQLVTFLRQREQTNKGKSAKPPPGFAVAANAQASAGLLGKSTQPSTPGESAASSRSEAASVSFPSLPAMQTSTSSTASLPAGMVSRTQPLHAGETGSSHPNPHWNSEASSAVSFQQWAYSSGANNLTSSSRSTTNSTGSIALRSPDTAYMFPVDLVAASAALWSAPAAGSNQLQSLSSFGFAQPLAPRKRKGPLYARSSSTTGIGAKEVSTSQMMSHSDASENKGGQQQSQWQTLGNGMFGDRVASLPPNRNGFSSNGLQSSMFPGIQGQEGSGNGPQVQSQPFANGLPANGSLFAHSGS
ncbi:hypothetical protein ABBQ32_011880 [Trebouxia sp. C0010 RCD-2024]